MGAVKELELLKREMAMDMQIEEIMTYHTRGIDPVKEQQYQKKRHGEYIGEGHPHAAVSKSMSTQVGGSHYQMAIQPVEFITKNNIPYVEGNIIKYVVRHKKKNGKEDLLKAKHYLEMLIEEYK